jgi:hypothetical protein
MLCAVCTVHEVMRSTSFSRFRLKTTRMVSPGLSSKPVARVPRFGSQNQTDFGLSIAPQNQWREDGAGHELLSGGLLHLEASRARVSQSGLKTNRGTTAGLARGTIVEVASGSS